MRTDKDSLTVADAGAGLVLTSMRRASMMGVPLEISGRDWNPELERRKAATRSASGFFHGLDLSSMGGRPRGRASGAGALPVVPTLVRSPTLIGTGVGGSVPQREHRRP